jgi:hypothetical protein
MRRLIAALASSAALGALPLAIAGPASADPVPDPAAYSSTSSGLTAPVIVSDTTPGTVSSGLITSVRCRLGGGVVAYNWGSPTKLSCYGGVYNRFWVLRSVL